MKRVNAFGRIISLILLAVILVCPITALAEEVKADEKKQVVIYFNTMGGSECEPIYGYAGETKIIDDMLPSPTKEGYTFKGWRHFNDKGMPFELTVFPNYDITLVAAFEPNGFSVSFEGRINATYDLNSGIELYGLKTENHNSDFIRNGWNSLRTKKGKESPMFLISYQNKLEVGKEYELTMWLNSDNERARGWVDLLYAENPDVRDVPLGYEDAFKINNLKKGEWCEYKVKFIAAAPYVIIRMPNVDGIYIDDVEIEHTGVIGKPAKLKSLHENNPVIIIVCITLIIVSISAAAAIIQNRNKKG